MNGDSHAYDLSFGDGCQLARNRDPVRVCKRSEKACPPCQRARDDDDDYEAETYGGGW